MNHLILFLFAAIFVYFITFAIRNFAQKIHFVDRPAERKVHVKPTPLMGGIAILLGILATLGIAFLICPVMVPFCKNYFYYICGLIMISALGLYDDRYGMKPMIKFSLQSFIALFFIIGTNHLTLLYSPIITIPILLIWMVGLMNALNFLDNMDGISAGIAFILGFGFFALGILLHNTFISLTAAIFMGASLGFLFHNFHPAKIFMGDSGSMLIGYTLSALGIEVARELFVQNNYVPSFSFLIPVILLSYAIFDISLVSITRQRDGRHILQGGKDHSTHRIGTATGSVKMTAIAVYLINILLVLITVIVFETSNEYLTLFTTIIVSLLFFFFGERLDHVPIVVSRNQLKKKPISINK